MIIDPTMKPDYTQVEKLVAPANPVIEKVLEVKEPRKTERSAESMNEQERYRQSKQGKGKKKKRFSLYV